MGYTKVIQSGDIIEVYEYSRSLPHRRAHRKATVRKRSGDVVRPRRPDSIYRLRKNFVRLILSNIDGGEAPAFVTLTMHQIVPLARAVRSFSLFTRRLRTRIGRDFRYVAVPEFQKRGAVHFHALVWGLPHGYVDEIIKETGQKITTADLHETNSRQLQNIWGRGFVDSIRTDGSPKLAGYLGKYMHKTLSDIRLGGAKAYYASRNIMRPMQAAGDTVGMWLDEIVDTELSTCQVLQNRVYDTQFFGRANYKKYRKI